MVVMSFLALKLSFQLPKDCDHDVDKLGAHMKPFFGPTWRKLLYEEARGGDLGNPIIWSFAALQFIV